MAFKIFISKQGLVWDKGTSSFGEDCRGSDAEIDKIAVGFIGRQEKGRVARISQEPPRDSIIVIVEFMHVFDIELGHQHPPSHVDRLGDLAAYGQGERGEVLLVDRKTQARTGGGRIGDVFPEAIDIDIYIPQTSIRSKAPAILREVIARSKAGRDLIAVEL